MAEYKVIEKIRNILKADTTIKGFVKDKVYAQHPSTIENPIFPAISIALLPGQARTNVPAMVDIVIQIDLWFPVDKYTVDDVMTCFRRVRALLHRETLKDTTIDIELKQIMETGIGPLMYDVDSKSHHLPARYAVVAI